MKIEIEAKIRVGVLDGFGNKLAGLGGEFQGSLVQRDVYFDTDDMSLLKSGTGVRLREQSCDDERRTIITYKGALGDGEFKSRREVETTVGDFEAMKSVLCGLGYAEKIVVEKKRDLWIAGGCYVCLDDVTGLGHFVEVEGTDDEHVSKVLAGLGLDKADHINESYAHLLSREI